MTTLIIILLTIWLIGTAVALIVPPFLRCGETDMSKETSRAEHMSNTNDHQRNQPMKIETEAMTDQQTRREAFEALVEAWRKWGANPDHPIEGCQMDERAAEIFSRCANELETALAQQKREVGEPVDGVVAIDGRPHLVRDPEYFVRTKKAQRLYAAPKQQDDERDAEMFKRGWDAAKEHFTPKQQAVRKWRRRMPCLDAH